MREYSAGLRVRVENDLRKEFKKACRDNDTTAAQVIRAFMRHYVSSHANELQHDLFGTDRQRN